MNHTRLFLTIILGLCLPAAGIADPKSDAMALGKEKFVVCGACHGLDGKGMQVGPMKMAPAYGDSKLVTASNPEAMALAILKGIKKETADYMQIMMPLEASLDDAQLAAIVTYVRNTYGAKDDLVTAEQAAEWRTKYAAIKAPVTRIELEEMAVKESGEKPAEAEQATE